MTKLRSFLPRGAVLYMLIAGVCFALVHALVKFLPHIPSHELVVARSIVSLIITWFALKKAGMSAWGQNKPMLVLRGLAGTGALVLYFYTLQRMPLATAVTVQYLHPIITVVLAALFLGERATWGQWICFGASFVGVLLVRGIDTRVTPLDLLLGVISAFLSATAYNLIRALRNEDHALVVMFYLPLVSLVVVGPWTFTHFVMPVGIEWPILLCIGIFTQIAQYFMTRAYQKDTAANISNLNYLGIFYASFIGYLMFDEQVMTISILGIAIIVGSAILSTRLRRKPQIVAPVTP